VKPNSIRKGLLVVAGGLALTLTAPFLIPVPPLKGTYPAHDLADDDSEFIQLNGLDIHIKKMGNGEPVLILLHGFASSLYTWNPVMQSLAQQCTVIAFDRPGFGLSERPLAWRGKNPYGMDAQVDLVIALLDHFGVKQAILMGNSAGGTVAMQVALDHPERVSSLILVDPAVYHGGGVPAWLLTILGTPQMRHLGPLFARQILSRGRNVIKYVYHDPARMSPDMEEYYLKPFKVENWDKSLWEFTLASHPVGLADRLSELNQPCLVITGDDDRIVPTRESIRLASELPDGRLIVIENAGHVPHEEQPQLFMNAVADYLQTVQVKEEQNVAG
jgi:pimeloyl-ACP methyl ester carboxylesterase